MDERYTAEEIAAFMEISVEAFLLVAGHADLVPFESEGQWFYREQDVRRFLVNAGVIDGQDKW